MSVFASAPPPLFGVGDDDNTILTYKLRARYVSPRKRAQRTLELLDLGCRGGMPWQRTQRERTQEQEHEQTQQQEEQQQQQQQTQTSAHEQDDIRTNATVEITDRIREWDYGAYEGLTSATIRALREKSGEGAWDIWRDGCPGGESPADITKRLDLLIHDIRSRFHAKSMGRQPRGSDGGPEGPSDVLLVAHGHILRAFAMRWIGRELTEGVALLLEAGGVGTLSYEHYSIDEPAILLGGAFMVDVVEKVG
ncbi:MAG: hypothetical protein LQ346_009080 [Caloplaca aetnensis]|nr:MAG: hypothetical protein LQ346_009080 [Caloplaca aetnensis]